MMTMMMKKKKKKKMKMKMKKKKKKKKKKNFPEKDAKAQIPSSLVGVLYAWALRPGTPFG